jgi:hypothetical protein
MKVRPGTGAPIYYFRCGLRRFGPAARPFPQTTRPFRGRALGGGASGAALISCDDGLGGRRPDWEYRSRIGVTLEPLLDLQAVHGNGIDRCRLNMPARFVYEVVIT